MVSKVEKESWISTSLQEGSSTGRIRNHEVCFFANEIWLKIFSYLPKVPYLLRLEVVCQQFRQVVNNKPLWQAALEKDPPRCALNIRLIHYLSPKSFYFFGPMILKYANTIFNNENDESFSHAPDDLMALKQSGFRESLLIKKIQEQPKSAFELTLSHLFCSVFDKESFMENAKHCQVASLIATRLNLNEALEIGKEQAKIGNFLGLDEYLINKDYNHELFQQVKGLASGLAWQAYNIKMPISCLKFRQAFQSYGMAEPHPKFLLSAMQVEAMMGNDSKALLIAEKTIAIYGYKAPSNCFEVVMTKYSEKYAELNELRKLYR